MGQRYRSSEMSAGRTVIVQQSGKAFVNGSGTVGTTQDLPGSRPKQPWKSLHFLGSVPVLLAEGVVAGNLSCATPSCWLFLPNQAVFTFSSISKLCFVLLSIISPFPCAIDKSLCLFVTVLIILSCMI